VDTTRRGVLTPCPLETINILEKLLLCQAREMEIHAVKRLGKGHAKILFRPYVLVSFRRLPKEESGKPIASCALLAHIVLTSHSSTRLGFASHVGSSRLSPHHSSPCRQTRYSQRNNEPLRVTSCAIVIPSSSPMHPSPLCPESQKAIYR